MRREVVTVSGTTPLDDLERVMESEGAGRLPVVSDEGKLLGLVTRTDVLRTLCDCTSLLTAVFVERGRSKPHG